MNNFKHILGIVGGVLLFMSLIYVSQLFFSPIISSVLGGESAFVIETKHSTHETPSGIKMDVVHFDGTGDRLVVYHIPLENCNGCYERRVRVFDRSNKPVDNKLLNIKVPVAIWDDK